MRDKEVFGLFVVVIMLAVSFFYITTDYVEYTAVAINENLLSEEFFTVKVYDSKRVDNYNLTEIRYIDDYSFLGSPKFEIIRLITNQTIYPDDKIELSRMVVMTECDWYRNIDGELVISNFTSVLHIFNLKSDYLGDYDKCGEKTFYQLLDNEVTHNEQ